MPNHLFIDSNRAWLLSVLATCLLSACDGGGDKSVNILPPAGEPGSNPQSSLTFSHDLQTLDSSPAEVKGGVLRTTLSSASQPTVTLDDLQIMVFGPMCSGCHSGDGLSQPAVFDFSSADETYATLVNKPSTQHASEVLVVPGNSGQSYLMRSLDGTQLSGSRMPMRSAPLNEDLMTAVRLWIDEGAKRN